MDGTAPVCPRSTVTPMPKISKSIFELNQVNCQVSGTEPWPWKPRHQDPFPVLVFCFHPFSSTVKEGTSTTPTMNNATEETIRKDFDTARVVFYSVNFVAFIFAALLVCALRDAPSKKNFQNEGTRRKLAPTPLLQKLSKI